MNNFHFVFRVLYFSFERGNRIIAAFCSLDRSVTLCNENIGLINLEASVQYLLYS